MCNCFPKSEKNKPEERRTPNRPRRSTSKPVTSQPKSVKATRRIVSSPSGMKTAELTEIFEIPSRQFATTEDVVQAYGFELGEELGKGTYATVYKAVRLRDRLPMACKIVEVGIRFSFTCLGYVIDMLFIVDRSIPVPPRRVPSR